MEIFGQTNKPPRTKSLSPAKSGLFFGTITPSPLGHVKVRKSDGTIIEQPMTRQQRRLLARRIKHG